MGDALEVSQLQILQTGEVTSCDLNPNYLLALGTRDKKLRILEWKTGLGFVDMFYSPLIYHKYAVTSVRFSPKGTMLASASLDGTAILIDVLTGAKIFVTAQDNMSNIRFCEFTFDCTKLITAADDGLLYFWNIVHHCQIRYIRLHEDDYILRGLAVSPDSEFLLSIDSGNLMKLWFIGDMIYSEPQCFLLKKNIHEDVLCCDFSPVKNVTSETFLKFNYCIATCCANGLVKVWDVVIGRSNCEANSNYFQCDLRLLHILEHDNDILSVRFNSTGNHIVSTGLDNLIKLWEVQTGNCLKTLKGHARYVTCGAFSKNSNMLVTGSADKTLIVWSLIENVTLDSNLLISCNISSHFTNINVINYQFGSEKKEEPKRYNEFAFQQKLTFPSIINTVQFQSNDVLAAAGGQKTVVIWKRQQNKFLFEEKETLKEHKSSINHLDVSPFGGKIISCSADGITFWDLNMNLSYKLKTPKCAGSLKTCKFSPDSKLIVAGGDDQKVYLWDAHNLEFLKVMQKFDEAVNSLTFTPDSKFLVITSGSGIIFQNLEHRQFTDKFHNAHDMGILCCDFSSFKFSETEYLHGSPCVQDKTGKYLLATGGDDSLVKLWKISDSKIRGLKALSGHGGAINYVKFSSADPLTLASCSSDHTIRIWETKRMQCLQVLIHHEGAVTACSFSKDSTQLATGSLDKSVLIFNLSERLINEPKELDRNSNKVLERWSSSDIANWFLYIGRPTIAAKVQAKQLNGRDIFSVTEDSIPDLFELTSKKEQKELKYTILSLKKSFGFPSDIQYKGNNNVPHKFLCPITHQIMNDPVICTDGYIYDRAAITEWFLGGRLISPITRECLKTTKLLPYSALKINIYKFIYETKSETFKFN